MDRRAFLGTLAGGLLAAPLAAEGQPRQRVARVAFLEAGNMGSELWQVTRDGPLERGTRHRHHWRPSALRRVVMSPWSSAAGEADSVAARSGATIPNDARAPQHTPT